MDSKEKFLNAATELFSMRGFSAVSVRDIAKAVGTKESAMYKHFEGKRALLDWIIEKAAKRLVEFEESLNVEGMNVVDALIFTQEKLFDLYILDEFMARFRKIMIISQYESEDAKARFREMFIDKTLKYYESVFSSAKLKDCKNAQPKMMAYELYSTLFLLILQFDCEIEVEKLAQAKSILRKHVENFFERYNFIEGK